MKCIVKHIGEYSNKKTIYISQKRKWWASKWRYAAVPTMKKKWTEGEFNDYMYSECSDVLVQVN